MAQILLISNDVVGPTMAGPGIRYVELARELNKKFSVVLAAPEPSEDIDDLQLLTYPHGHFSSLIPHLEKAKVVIAQSLHPKLLRVVRNRDIRYIADLYDPIVLENLEAQRTLTLDEQQKQNDYFLTIMNTQLSVADHILCASERQRDYWLGALTALGRVTPEMYRDDPALNSLISILPFGYKDAAPKVTNEFAIQTLVPHFNPEKDHLLIWGGGIWNWFDPLSLIKAVAHLADRRNDIKLLFLGTKHPNPHTPEMKVLNEAHALAEELRIKDSFVFFNEGWVPYDELSNYFLPAAIGVSTHFDHAETRMSFRTRILTYIWAGLPILATKGDAMSDLIEKEHLGATVDYQDVDGIVAAIEYLIDKETAKGIRKNLARIWPEYTWKRLVRPLARRIRHDQFTDQKISGRDFNRLIARYYLTGAKKIWQKGGLKGLFRKLGRG